MSVEDLLRRGHSLEDQFFAQQDYELLERLRRDAAAKKQKAMLTEVTGIRDEAVLQKLLDLNLNTETVMALSLIPLVQVAWADGSVHQREREAVLAAAAQEGIESESVRYQLLQSWLDSAPDAQLLEVWGDYVRALCQSLDAASCQELKSRLLGNAHAVAAAAGGILGLGGKVSKSEQAVLDRLAEAFSC